jgi:aminoglycoside phosphotransferase (APT) family kinase protein
MDEERAWTDAPATAKPDSASQVAAMLRWYFRHRLGMSEAGYIAEPAEYPDGWETYTYHFQLQSFDPVPEYFLHPLIVRIYASSQGLPRARHEFAVQRHLHQLNYPVAEPYILEESGDYFGGPFLIMAQAPGQTLFRTLLQQPWKIVHAPALMAEAHARLHQLPSENFPSPSRSLLNRSLDEMTELTRTYSLPGLKPGVDWLRAHRPEDPVTPRILHLDYHPLNLIHQDSHPLIVLDWTEADVGDLHADVATTLMLMECVSPDAATLGEQCAIALGRFFLAHGYLQVYRNCMPTDETKLSYYRAWAACRRLGHYGKRLRVGPLGDGYKPSSIRYLHPNHFVTLQDYFHQWTGVGIQL